MKLFCLVGPTASGKTALAVEISKKLDMEVVTCDSMQVYRGFDIGTAKPSQEEQQGVRHYMLDVAEPYESYSAARYANDAEGCIDDIVSRGKTPLVAGGTGFYLRALTRGLHSADAVPDSPESDKTNAELHAQLCVVDPETADRLTVNDRKRVLRALMVFESTGVPLSEHHRLDVLRPDRHEAVIIGLNCPDRQVLYDRADRRVDVMFEMGLEQEVRELLGGGVPARCTAMQAIGYKELAGYFRGEITLEQAKNDIKQATRNLAKRQLTWFRQDKRIFWMDMTDSAEKLADNCAKYILQ